MNTPLFMAFVVTAVIVACSSDDDAKKPVVLPEKMESTDSKLEFSHNSDNKIASVKSSYYYPNNVVLVTNYEYTYTSEGNYKQCLTDNGYRFDYTYEGGKLVRTDEYINDSFTQYYAFAYNDEGRVTEIITWQNIPEEGGWIPVSKGTYTYENSNVTQQKLYYYSSGTQQHHLQTTFDYGQYDSKKSVEELFANFTLNPTLRLSENNPGIVTTTNGNGVTSFVAEFSYSYDDLGYPVARTIGSTVVSSGETSVTSQDYTYLKR